MPRAPAPVPKQTAASSWRHNIIIIVIYFGGSQLQFFFIADGAIYTEGTGEGGAKEERN